MTIKLKAALPQREQVNSLLNLDEQDLVDDPRQLVAVVRLRPLSAKQMLDGSGADELVLDVVAVEHLGGRWADMATQLMLDARGQRTGQPPLFRNVGEFTPDELAIAVAALLVGGYDEDLVAEGIGVLLVEAWLGAEVSALVEAAA